MKIDNTKYIRDKNSKAILQSDRNALDNYRAAKKQKETEINVINNLVTVSYTHLTLPTICSV